MALAALGLALAATPATAGESLSAPALAQVREFLAFHEGDAWVRTRLGILERLCRDQDRLADRIRGVLSDAPDERARAVHRRVEARFEELAANDFLYVQAIALWEIEHRRAFDLNFFHGLAVRSAINAVRLEQDAVRASAGAGAGARREGAALDELERSLAALRADGLSADPALPGEARLAELRRAHAGLARNLDRDDVRLVRVRELGDLDSFFELVRAVFPAGRSRARGFADVYELQQYLLFFAPDGEPVNAAYALGPFNVSRLTADLTRPDPSRPPVLPGAGWFAGRTAVAGPAPYEPGEDPLAYLATHSRRSFAPGELPPALERLRSFLRQAPGKKGPVAVSDEVYENRLFVLTAMSDQDFFERFRSVKNDRLFFDRARSVLGLARLKGLLREPYALPGGGEIVLPRYELLGYDAAAFEGEGSLDALVARIPRKVHIDFVRPLVLATFEGLDRAEKRELSTQRIGEIAAHFGSPAGRVGDRATFLAFWSLFADDVAEGARALARTGGLDELEATRWLAALVAIESRGNVFAVSPTGALGPFQHTYYFYLKTAPPSIPFDPGASAVKTGTELGRYHARYRARRPAEAAELAMVAYNQGPGTLDRALAEAVAAGDPASWRERVPAEGRRYADRFRQYRELAAAARTAAEVGERIGAALR